jgi:tRNA A37 threonylcarbamoyladenosine synthetase subunit TsaC/SUA5/YrdC
MAQFIKKYTRINQMRLLLQSGKGLKDGGLIIYPTDTVYDWPDITNTKAL